MCELVENDGRRFLKVGLFGTLSTDELEKAREAAIQMCEKTQTKCILVDLREAELNLSRSDTIGIADSSALTMPKHIKSAVLKKEGQPGHDAMLNFYELASHNRGRDVRVFDDMDTAEKWLLG